MNSEEKFWIRFWGMVITGFVLIIFSISGCTIHQNTKVAKAIESGIPAEKARIAFSSQVSETEKIVALIMATLEKNRESL